MIIPAGPGLLQSSSVSDWQELLAGHLLTCMESQVRLADIIGEKRWSVDVPGGVQNGPRPQSRRTPDEVRGLLSAYHRGVQRGRTDGSAETTSASQVKEREQ